MKDIQNLLRRYRIWENHLEKVANEIGENELTFRPMPESNSAAWILVHLINNYRDFLELTEDGRNGMKDLPSPAEKDLATMPFSRIFSLFQDYRAAFYEMINHLGEKEMLDDVAPAGEDKSWRDLVHTVVTHEIYHCGQLAYIARILQQRAGSSD